MAKSFPLIGISGSIDEKETQHFLMRCYSSALLAANAVPLLLSPDLTGEMLDQVLDTVDGIFLSGGNDLAPDLFGEDPVQNLGEVNPLRDRFEMELIQKAWQRRMPVFGICRGIQSMNVALGGSLWQDLPSQYRTADGKAPILHRQTAMDCYMSHGIQVRMDSLLYRLIEEETIRVNSFHHQAVKEAAPSLVVTARASDGVIEAIECPDHPFFLGVQWHPERYYKWQEDSMVLFKAFAEAALRYSEKQTDKLF